MAKVKAETEEQRLRRLLQEAERALLTKEAERVAMAREVMKVRHGLGYTETAEGEIARLRAELVSARSGERSARNELSSLVVRAERITEERGALEDEVRTLRRKVREMEHELAVASEDDEPTVVEAGRTFVDAVRTAWREFRCD